MMGAAGLPQPPKGAGSGVVDVVAAHGTCRLFELVEGVHRAGEFELELVPFRALVAARILPLGELIVSSDIA